MPQGKKGKLQVAKGNQRRGGTSNQYVPRGPAPTFARAASMGSAVANTLTEEGYKWMVSALDPFHDYQQSLRGYPDSVSHRSTIQVFNQTQTITTALAGSNWDCRIVYTGLDGYMTAHSGDVVLGDMYGASYDMAQAYTGKYLYPLMGFTSVAGVNPSFSNYVAGTATQALAMNTQKDVTHFKSRVIGMAIEVHNVTSSLYKQGTVTMAQYPSTLDWGTASYLNSNAAPELKHMILRRLTSGPHPTTADQVKVFPESGTWEAGRGVYLIPRMQGTPPTNRSYPNNGNIYFEDGSYLAAQAAYHTQIKDNMPYIDNKGWDIGYGASAFSPFCIYFSGLSEQTTLRVTFRTITEIFPCVNDTFITNANMSPPYDPVAIALYQKICCEAPYAVPVDFNDAGKYFRMILQLIQKVARGASPLLTTINPLAGLIAGGVGSGAGLIQGVFDKATKGRYIDKDAAGLPAVPFS